MINISEHMEWVTELIPDLTDRLAPFVVEPEELDEELLKVFLAEIKRLTIEMQEGLAQDDEELICSAAHSLKGMGGTIGLPEISVLGLELEVLVRNDRLAEIAPLIEGLKNWLTTFF
jgi:HPt (histidine-containing phosphotransfer) domain-containing protein